MVFLGLLSMSLSNQISILGCCTGSVASMWSDRQFADSFWLFLSVGAGCVLVALVCFCVSVGYQFVLILAVLGP